MKKLIISLLISLGVGGLSALITGSSMDTYKYLVKPPLAPPSILFPIVWTILFILMGISAYMVYDSGDENNSLKTEELKVIFEKMNKDLNENKNEFIKFIEKIL